MTDHETQVVWRHVNGPTSPIRFSGHCMWRRIQFQQKSDTNAASTFTALSLALTILCGCFGKVPMSIKKAAQGNVRCCRIWDHQGEKRVEMGSNMSGRWQVDYQEDSSFTCSWLGGMPSMKHKWQFMGGLQLECIWPRQSAQTVMCTWFLATALRKVLRH